VIYYRFDEAANQKSSVMGVVNGPSDTRVPTARTCSAWALESRRRPVSAATGREVRTAPSLAVGQPRGEPGRNGRGLGFSASGLQWVVTMYTLIFGGFMLLGGRAGDVIGRKRVFSAGISLRPLRCSTALRSHRRC
jgi:hypothetical protein